MQKRQELTLEQMEARVAAWAATPEGQREIERTAREARAAAERMLQDAKVTPAQMREPVTI